MKIQVTASDIINGRPNSCCACPIALAVRRYVNCEYIAVSNKSVELRHGYTSMYGYELPLIAQNFITVYDNLKKEDIPSYIEANLLKPFEFELKGADL